MTSKNGPNPAAESSIVAQSRTVSRTASRKTEPPGKGSSLPLDVACESSGLGSDCREGGPHRAANPSPTLPPEWIGHRAHFGRESRLWTHSAPSFPLSLPGLPSRRVRKGWKSKLRINRSPQQRLATPLIRVSVLPLVSDQDPAFVRSAFSAIAPRYVVANHVLSLGIDVLWRRHTARVASEINPRRILDLATGSGDLAATLRSRCPEAEIVGADFCAPMLKEARKRNLPALVVADGLALPFADGVFDVVTVAWGLRNMASWSGAISEMRRVLRPGGRLAVLDFSLPTQPLLRSAYRWYLHRLLPTLGGWIAGDREAYRYLGESIERFPAGQAMCDLIQEAGFETVRAEPLMAGISSLYVADVAP